MKELLKFGLIGVGGWLLLRQFQARSSITPPSAGLPAGPGATVPVVGGPPSRPETLRLVLDAAGGVTALNADEWNYYYSEVRNVPGPDPLVVWPGRDRSAQMTAEEWYAGVSRHGVTGLGRRW